MYDNDTSLTEEDGKLELSTPFPDSIIFLPVPNTLVLNLGTLWFNLLSCR